MFNPNAAAQPDSGVFGLPALDPAGGRGANDRQLPALVYLPVPWEVTTSYGGGTALGPSAILAASKQVELFHPHVARPYEAGLVMLPISDEVLAWNEQGKRLAQPIIEAGGVGGEEAAGFDPALASALKQVNAASVRLNEWVRSQARAILQRGQIAVVVGGDHSTPFGAIQAYAEREPKGFGILHFDAHSDTRDAFEGFEWSHASIFRNVLERIPEVTRLVQVGIRDYCEEELEYCRAQGDRVRIFFDHAMSARKHEGEPWRRITHDIVDSLPERVYISFDIDGLDPVLCPHTGTPVPGGLSYPEALAVIEQVARSGRRIIGFDLNEVAPSPAGEGEWDANVGARLLYQMTAWTLRSQGRAQAQESL